MNCTCFSRIARKWRSVGRLLPACCVTAAWLCVLPARAATERRVPGWFVENGLWWLCSFLFHLLLVGSLALLGTMGTRAAQQMAGEAPAFDEVNRDQAAEAPKEIERFEVGQTPEEPTELNTDTLTLAQPGGVNFVVSADGAAGTEVTLVGVHQHLGPV